jgi:hypothetical protein
MAVKKYAQTLFFMILSLHSIVSRDMLLTFVGKSTSSPGYELINVLLNWVALKLFGSWTQDPCVSVDSAIPQNSSQSDALNYQPGQVDQMKYGMNPLENIVRWLSALNRIL